jgi:LPXTG-motif cell wall-anchored protein
MVVARLTVIYSAEGERSQEGTMRINRVGRLSCAAAILSFLTASAAFAQPVDKRTYFTFKQPTAVPGVTLPAGTYLFRIAELGSRDIVQVFNEKGTTTYSSFFVRRAERTRAPADPEVRFLETGAGMPQAVRTWWYPNERAGYEFVYPKEQARRLAKGAGQPVLTAEVAAIKPEAPAPAPPKEFARITPSGEEVKIETEPMPEEVVGPALRGEVAPPTVSPAAPESLQARAELPKTGSNAPLLALAGALLILSGVLVGVLRVGRT